MAGGFAPVGATTGAVGAAGATGAAAFASAIIFAAAAASISAADRIMTFSDGTSGKIRFVPV